MNWSVRKWKRGESIFKRDTKSGGGKKESGTHIKKAVSKAWKKVGGGEKGKGGGCKNSPKIEKEPLTEGFEKWGPWAQGCFKGEKASVLKKAIVRRAGNQNLSKRSTEQSQHTHRSGGGTASSEVF